MVDSIIQIFYILRFFFSGILSIADKGPEISMIMDCFLSHLVLLMYVSYILKLCYYIFRVIVTF